MAHAQNPVLTLRPATPEDDPFLRALHAETRAREMAMTGWPEAFQASFLQGQFDAQHRSYRQRYPDASFNVVVVAGKPVGRLYVARLPDAVVVVDITLRAASRERGWGTVLLRKVIAEADGRRVPVRLHVAENNRAQRLYRRLGFQETGREGFYLRLERPTGGKDGPLL